MIQQILKRLARRILRTELDLLKSTVKYQESIYSELLDQKDYLYKEVQKYTENPIVEKHYGISREVFRKKVLPRLEPGVVSSNTTAHQTGYLLGIQRALKVVEEEAVHD